MDLNRMRYFCVIAETGNMRRAAELLRLTPAALSKSMKILESEAGRQLFIPSGRGIALTDPGRELATRFKVLLRDFEAALRPGSSADTAKGAPLRLGSFEVFTTYFLGSLMRDQFPEMRLELHDLAPGQLETAMAAHRIDLGISYLPIPHAELDYLKATAIEMAVFSRKSAFPPDVDFAELPFAVPITPIEGSPNKVRGLDGWPESAAPRTLKYQVTLMESALELCRQGLAVAYLPRFAVLQHNERVRESLRLEPLRLPSQVTEKLPKERQPVYIIKRKTDPESRNLKLLARALRMIGP